MNIGFTTVTFRKKSIEEIIDIALDNDIKCIEWGGDIHLPCDDTATANKIKNMTDSKGISNISYGSYYKIGEHDIAKFTQICEVASVIGAKIIRVWLGEKSKVATSVQDFAAYITETRELCDIASKYGLVVASEFHNNTCNDSAKAAREFITSVGIVNLKTLWQPLGDDEIDIANLRELTPHICEIHIFNWKANGKRMLLAKGEEKWRKFLQAYKENIANDAQKSLPNFVLEFVKGDSAKTFAKDVATLKRLLGEIFA